MRAVLRSALSDAVKWRVVPFNAAAAASVPRASRVQIPVFTAEEARKFLGEADNDRLGAIFSVALALGLRLGEALDPRSTAYCASLLLVQGVHPRIVMETLGHSQISLTMDTYSHVLPALQQEAARQIDTLLTVKT
jgi:integrase